MLARLTPVWQVKGRVCNVAPQAWEAPAPGGEHLQGAINLPRVEFTQQAVTGGAFPRKVGEENRTVTVGRRLRWPRMAGLQPLSTRAFGPRLRRLTALTALATRPLIATKRPTARCGQSVCKCHAEKSRSANFARILTAVHNKPLCGDCGPVRQLFSAASFAFLCEQVRGLRRVLRGTQERHAPRDRARLLRRQVQPRPAYSRPGEHRVRLECRRVRAWLSVGTAAGVQSASEVIAIISTRRGTVRLRIF